jgi:acyl-CoA synthetase (NDP forming)
MESSQTTPNPSENARRALSEYDSKQLLAPYGIPVVPETRVESAVEAVAAAEKTGYPVVLKGLGKALMHKTERNLVHLNLWDKAAVESAAAAIAENAGDLLEGFLVQPQIAGKREFVAGMFRDRQYGPVIMFGLGGIFTEALSDVTFRLAPLSETDVADMLDDIQSRKLLGDFRGGNARRTRPF